MLLHQRGSGFASIFGIAVCGVAGGAIAWSVVDALEMSGVLGALLAAVIGMIAATTLWIAGVAMLRTMGWIR